MKVRIIVFLREMIPLLLMISTRSISDERVDNNSNAGPVIKEIDHHLVDVNRKIISNRKSFGKAQFIDTYRGFTAGGFRVHFITILVPVVGVGNTSGNRRGSLERI